MKRHEFEIEIGMVVDGTELELLVSVSHPGSPGVFGGPADRWSPPEGPDWSLVRGTADEEPLQAEELDQLADSHEAEITDLVINAIAEADERARYDADREDR